MIKSTGIDLFTFYATTGAEKCNHQLFVATTGAFTLTSVLFLAINQIIYKNAADTRICKLEFLWML